MPSGEAYRLSVTDEIGIESPTDAGILYGIASLVQLRRSNAKGGMAFPKCEIEDYPDVPYRFASRWLIELECARMAYDWGDGRENLLERYRKKIDFCMRYKINAAFFEGFEWKTDKYPGYIDDIKGLNLYARSRNVRLTFGGHVIGYGGVPGHTMAGAKGLGGFNRVSYPDGAIYDCGRTPGGFNPFQPSVSSDTMRNGTCRSNDALNRLKQLEIADYVRQVEPGVLYLHSEDISMYEEFRQMWLHRCEACRHRWPSDEIASREGAAGAIAHGFQSIYDGIASVRNPETGFNGTRDCLVVFVSPTYGKYHESDADWGEISDFWTTISKELGNRERILFGVREQFWSEDGKTKRIPALAERLIAEGGGHGLFAFAVGGADLFKNSALFSAAPRLNHFYQGAAGIFNFNGGLFASAQEIYNSEYTWNLFSPFGRDEAGDRESAIVLYRKRSEEMVHLPEDRLLRMALRLCYEDAAPVMEAFYALRDEENHFPLAIPYRLCRLLFSKRFEEHDRVKQERQWRGLNKVTVRAGELVDRALEYPLFESFFTEELRYLKGCLAFGARFSEVVAEVFAATSDFNALHHRIEELRNFVCEGYPSDFTSVDDGEMNLWPTYLDRLDAFIGETEMTVQGYREDA